VTKFFEPINVSATHIYHSALELSPLSSIVRRLYYHQRHTPFPRVAGWNPRFMGPESGPSLCGQSKYEFLLGHPVANLLLYRLRRLWRSVIHSALNYSPPSNPLTHLSTSWYTCIFTRWTFPCLPLWHFTHNLGYPDRWSGQRNSM
jgi:hypothetical protein